MIAPGQHVVEQLERLLAAADAGQRIDVPEGAEQEGVGRRAEIVGLDVAHEEAVLHQLLGHHVERGVEARVVGAQQADLGKAPGWRRRPCRGRARPTASLPMSCHAAGSPGAARPPWRAIRAIRRRAPTRRAIRPSRCWAAQHMAAEKVWTSSRSRYSHRPASGVRAARWASLPTDAELAIELDVALPRQALVPEHLRGRQHHRAVDVVLALADRRVADAHRPVAAIAGQGVDQALDRVGARRDGEQRRHVLDLAARTAGLDHVDDEAHVAFHGARRRQPVERRHGEEGIAQPGEAVVPVAHRAGRLRHRGRERGQHRTGILVAAQLEGDGGADDRRPASRTGC